MKRKKDRKINESAFFFCKQRGKDRQTELAAATPVITITASVAVNATT